ncbi:MAG TPA: hypothetical protein VMD56_12115 [Steroidobacteraceae bacterium]|nr:hypothetical protein [Steroidobacteraceae bacterium]
MSAKPQMVNHLGEGALLLPQLLERALAANERLKLCFTLLQAAERHADHQEPIPDLAADLRAAQLDVALLESAGASRREPGGELYLPGAQRIRERIVADLAAMLAPLEPAKLAEAEALAARARALLAALPAFEADRVPAGLIARVTCMRRPPHAAGADEDSLHALVMDLHRALNALQASLAEEELDGARVWRIAAADRPLVRAFMSGVNRTAPLKFSHPGLGTTATRAGGRLIIQNDIGENEAHLLVLHVEGMTATLTYTDVHAQRLAFLQSLLTAFPIEWSAASARTAPFSPAGDGYFLTVGRFEAADAAALERYLAFFGSRIVFLIDWNRARKRLQAFVSKPEAVRLLKWAADRDIGHRGFLEIGAERVVYEAIEFAQQTPLHFGERLDETLGPEAAFKYLQFVLNEAASGLLQGRLERFIRDEIKAELARRLRSAHVSLLTIGLAHAERVFDLASLVHEGILRCAQADAPAFLQRAAARARRWESDCDAMVSRLRSLARRNAKFAAYAALMHEADEAADGLEEAAFLMTHLAATAAPAQVLESLRGLAALLVTGAQESVRMFEAASHVSREGAREDLQDFFAAADQTVAIEHSIDTAERGVTGTLFAHVVDARTLFLVSSLARVLEHAADAFALTAYSLRDHLLNEVASA